MIRRSLPAGLLAAALLLSAGPAPLGQQCSGSSQDSSLVLKTTVHRVILDVVVTDSLGHAVRGLTEKDFAVAEDNKPQKVLSFDTHDFDPTLDFDPPKLPPLDPGTYVNVPTEKERGPLYVILYDLVNMEQEDQSYARQQLLKFIRTKPEGSRFAIFVLSDKLQLVQGFTSDADKLLEVMDPRSPRPHIPMIFLYGKNHGRGDTGMMVDVFNFIAQYLNGLPGRKNLIWMSSGFPLTLFPNDDDGQSYRDEIKLTLAALAREQVAIYPVDARGAVVENAKAPSGATGGGGSYNDFRSGSGSAPAAGAPAGSPGGSSGGGPSQPSGGALASNSPYTGGAGYSLLASSYMIQDEVAKVTGGQARYSSNDLKGALEEATDSGASYYTLTYSPTNPKYDGKLRNISVDLAKRGYKLAYRRSYYAIDPDTPVGPVKRDVSYVPAEIAQPRKPGDTLFANMQHGAPLTYDLLFRAQVKTLGPAALATPEQMLALAQQPAFVKSQRKKPGKPLPPIQLQSYQVDYTMLSRQLKLNTGSFDSLSSTLEVAVAAYDADGKMLNGAVQNATREPSLFAHTSTSSGFYRITQRIDAPLNAAWLRLAVHDPATDRVGAMEIPLPLPPVTPNQASQPSDAAQPSTAKPN